MDTQITLNDFLSRLLGTQQDGRAAISAPRNWGTPPVLEVPTDLDSIIDELLEIILNSATTGTEARWHFFIGSPGNGKSSLVGRLYRSIVKHNWIVEDEDGASLDGSADASTPYLPYLIRIRNADEKYPVAYIIQDASVSRSPYASDSDPTRDLMEAVRDAWKRGICLIVCTNRGVLESASRKHYLDPKVNDTRWFQIIRDLAIAESHINGIIGTNYIFAKHKNSVFRTLRVTYSHLDNRSLLINCNTVEHMLKLATCKTRWEACGSCRVRHLCPYKANQEWLSKEQSQSIVVRLLRRAEVISGQVIVLREAGALIALLLAGCTRDYNNDHPCAWVHHRVDSNDFFSLAQRRIYMSLLGSWAPHGLEPSISLRKRQLRALCGLSRSLRKQHQSRAFDAITHVINGHNPSTDVGVHRLLGERTAFAHLDPCLDALPSKFYDQWDSDLSAIITQPSTLFTRIEQSCIDVWMYLYESVENDPKSLPTARWAIKRWSSAFLMRFATLEQGLSANGPDLDTFVDLLSIQTNPKQSKSERRKLRDADRELRSIMDAVLDHGSVQLSDTVWLEGEWVQNSFRAKLSQTSSNEGSGGMALLLRFGDKTALLSAATYLCLRRIARMGLHRRCASDVLLEGIKTARINAVATSKYSFVQEGIEMTVRDLDEGRFILTRTGDDVDVESVGGQP